MSREGLPEVVKGGVGHDGLAARPLKRLCGTGGVMAWVHIRRSRLPGTHHARIDEYPMEQRTYLVAVLRGLVNVWFGSGVGAMALAAHKSWHGGQ